MLDGSVPVGLRCPVINTQHFRHQLCGLCRVTAVHLLNQVKAIASATLIAYMRPAPVVVETEAICSSARGARGMPER